jgi:hypothetical protein
MWDCLKPNSAVIKYDSLGDWKRVICSLVFLIDKFIHKWFNQEALVNNNGGKKSVELINGGKATTTRYLLVYSLSSTTQLFLPLEAPCKGMPSSHMYSNKCQLAYGIAGKVNHTWWTVVPHQLNLSAPPV